MCSSKRPSTRCSFGVFTVDRCWSCLSVRVAVSTRRARTWASPTTCWLSCWSCLLSCCHACCEATRRLRIATNRTPSCSRWLVSRASAASAGSNPAPAASGVSASGEDCPGETAEQQAAWTILGNNQRRGRSKRELVGQVEVDISPAVQGRQQLRQHDRGDTEHNGLQTRCHPLLTEPLGALVGAQQVGGLD